MLRLLQWLFPGRRPDRGSRGEKAAADWLRRERRFSVVAQNWRNPRDRRDELDLVCRDGDVLVFVEVKARATGALVPGYFAVDRRKKRVLKRAAQSYLAQLRDKPRTVRFDVVEVSLGEDGAGRAKATEVLHFENVPLFAKHYRP